MAECVIHHQTIDDNVNKWCPECKYQAVLFIITYQDKKVAKMKDIEEMNKKMDEELEKSPALKMAFVQIRGIDTRVKKLEANEICGQCGAEVPRNEWHLIYGDTEGASGVCEGCWQKHYVPFMPKVKP